MNRTLSAIALVVVALAGVEFFALQVLKPLDHRLLDRFVRSQAAVLQPDPEIILIDIDEKSLAKMEDEAGRWPWSRVVHATLVTCPTGSTRAPTVGSGTLAHRARPPLG